MRAIRFVCVTVALAGMLNTAHVQAQAVQVEAKPQEELREGPALLLSDRPSAADQIESPAASDNAVSRDALSEGPLTTSAAKVVDDTSSLPDDPQQTRTTSTQSNPDEEYGKQGKRILGIVPNYRAVSANTHLPPLAFKDELWLATQDTFDYSDFIFVAALSGIDLAGNAQPTFGQDAEGYGKYFWHVFVDTGVENYMAEAIVPWATREDPRYYTLGKGGFPKRALYALDRLFITRTNSGGSTFNLSEVVGAGAAAGIGNLYYPKEANTFVKTYQRWGTQVGLDGVFNVVKEFWPDINRKLFHNKY